VSVCRQLTWLVWRRRPRRPCRRRSLHYYWRTRRHRRQLIQLVHKTKTINRSNSRHTHALPVALLHARVQCHHSASVQCLNHSSWHCRLATRCAGPHVAMRSVHQLASCSLPTATPVFSCRLVRYVHHYFFFLLSLNMSMVAVDLNVQFDLVIFTPENDNICGVI